MRIEEITKQNLSEASDLVLKQLNFKMAKFWDRHFKKNTKNSVGCFTREEFLAKYRMLLKEMSSSERSLSKSTCDIDRAAFRQKMQAKQHGIDFPLFENITTQKNFVCINEDFENTNEIKITIRAVEPTSFTKFVEKQITAMLKDQTDKPCSFTYDIDFEGKCIPLYNGVLIPTRKMEKVDIKNPKEEIEKDIEIIPVEKQGDEHIVMGIVYEPDTVDAQNDKANADEIKKAAYEFMEDVQTFKVMHRGSRVKVKILENYIAPIDFKVNNKQVKKGSWVLVTRILDEKLWNDIKAGNLTGYSMAGYARVS